MKNRWLSFFLAKRDLATHLYVLSFVLFIVGVVLGGWFFVTMSASRSAAFFVDGEDEEVSVEEAVVPESICEFSRFLDGVCVDSEEEQSVPVVAVMVENHVDARPLSGIADAAIVYESPVEGNITRFMALFLRDSNIVKVGPVRSARPYYLDWLSEYPGAMYMHVGGSPEALDRISQFGLFDMNEFYRGWYFWRDQHRYAPHNVYTSSNLWKTAWTDYGDTAASVQSTHWQFSLQDECEVDCSPIISVSYQGHVYGPTWMYTSSTGQYTRFENGRTYRDEQGNPIVVDTLVVQRVVSRVIDDVGRLRMDTIGSGEAVVFRDGYATEGVWKKDSRESQTVFEDSDGKSIPLHPGKIWIQ
ncbi:MAG: hypothetical protein COU30_02945, partial [Candidatus Magasanikbacteria bacterium CG10_big_fil_rev_8_21_14_0_10_38_6]